MMNSNLSQDEIDALLGVDVESVIETDVEENVEQAEETSGGDEPPANTTPPVASGNNGFMDEMTRGMAEAFFRDCIGNTYEQYSEIINVSSEFHLIDLAEYSKSSLQQLFNGQTIIKIDSDIKEPVDGKLVFIMKKEYSQVFGDILMGSDGSEPTEEMESSYVQAITESLKRLSSSALEGKFTDLTSHQFRLKVNDGISIQVDDTFDPDLSDEIIMCHFRMVSIIEPPEGKKEFEFYFLASHEYIKKINPENISKYIKIEPPVKVTPPVAEPVTPSMKDIAPPPEDNSALTLEQGDVDALLAQVQAAIGEPASESVVEEKVVASPVQQQPIQKPQTVEPTQVQQPQVNQQAAASLNQQPMNQQPQQQDYNQQPQQQGFNQQPQQQGFNQQPMNQQPINQQGFNQQPQQQNYNQQPINQQGFNQQPPVQPMQQSGGNQIYSQQPMFGGQNIQNVNFAPLNFTSPQGKTSNMELLLDVPLQITVELGRTKMLIKEILDLSEGSIVELEKIAGEAIDLLVNNKLVAKGEVVVIDENFGIRITSIVSPQERLAKIG